MLDGNSDMSNLIASLTPPPPVSKCSDFTNSKSLGPAYPWPLPGWSGGNGTLPVTAGAVTAAADQASAASSAAASSAAAGVAAPVVSSSPASATPTAAPTPAGVPGWAPGNLPRGAGFGRGRANRRISQSGYYLRGGLVEQLGQSIRNFTCPQPTRVLTVPAVAPAASAAPVAPPAVVPSPAPAAAPACPPQSACMTGNICLDLKRGCVSSNQLSSQQLQACAEAGYEGLELFFPCVLANPNLPYLGTPMPNPPPYSSVESQDVPPSGNWNTGLSGLGCGGDGPGTLLGMLGIVLGVAGGLYLSDWLRRKAAA